MEHDLMSVLVPRKVNVKGARVVHLMSKADAEVIKETQTPLEKAKDAYLAALQTLDKLLSEGVEGRKRRDAFQRFTYRRRTYEKMLNEAKQGE